MSNTIDTTNQIVTLPPPKPRHEHKYIYGGMKYMATKQEGLQLYDWWWCEKCLDEQVRKTTRDIGATE